MSVADRESLTSWLTFESVFRSWSHKKTLAQSHTPSKLELMEEEPEEIQGGVSSMLIMIICELKLTEFGSARAFILGFISNGTPSRPVNESSLIMMYSK